MHAAPVEVLVDVPTAASALVALVLAQVAAPGGAAVEERTAVAERFGCTQVARGKDGDKDAQGKDETHGVH